MITAPLTNIAAKPGVQLDEEVHALIADISPEDECNSQIAEFLRGVFSHSPFLLDCALKEPEILRLALSKGWHKAIETVHSRLRDKPAGTQSEAGIMTSLRVAKRQAALICGLADLGVWWQDQTVTEALTMFAETSLQTAFDFILSKAHEAGTVTLANPNNPQHDCGIIVLGMGKLGAGELNYSSDIDIILFFDEAAGISINHDDPITLLNRFGKQLVKIMQERTADGYVFRTDLRLRPDPSSTPLIIPVEAALNYYESQGQNWERSAMIKANPVAGDIEKANAFLKELSPFIWRKYLDFAAINDVHSIKRQIHAHKGHSAIAVFGHNIKLGRGGIREIEFFAQTQQLIAGGRNEALRTMETIASLEELFQSRWIEEQAKDELTDAYWFLRSVEHRLQMVRDEQTHTLPETPGEFQSIASLSGYDNVSEFEKKTRATLECVEQHYAALFETSPSLSSISGNLVFTGDEADPDTLTTIVGLGFENPVEIVKTIQGWHRARVPALRTTTARELLTELVPHLLETFSKTENPDGVFLAFDRFVSGLPAGIQLFSIMKENAELSSLLVRILDTAPRLAEQIARKPHVFDAMLEPENASLCEDKEQLLKLLRQSLSRSTEYEVFLDAIRQFAAEARFQIGVRLFNSALGWKQAAAEFSNLAEAMVEICFERVHEEFASAHGKVSGASVCILAMGRLGSRELTATSDLDLIFLYDLPDEASESDGKKPLDPALYYVRLIQRFISAMTAPTSEGVLYPLDFRLRPSGNAGPLATSVEGFFKYQNSEAWVWEAQALTRARAVCGDKALTQKVHSGIAEVLCKIGDRHNISVEISKMRKLIDKEKGSTSPWKLKTVRGGLIDIEFIAQWFALENSPELAGKTATSDVLDWAVAQKNGLDHIEILPAAFAAFSDILQLERACLGSTMEANELPSGFQATLCNRLDLPTIEACEAHLRELQGQVEQCFDGIFNN